MKPNYKETRVDFHIRNKWKITNQRLQFSCIKNASIPISVYGGSAWMLISDPSIFLITWAHIKSFFFLWINFYTSTSANFAIAHALCLCINLCGGILKFKVGHFVLKENRPWLTFIFKQCIIVFHKITVHANTFNFYSIHNSMFCFTSMKTLLATLIKSVPF